jgi:hypothetical protein
MIMNKATIKPFNVVDNTPLPEIYVDHIPAEGDPLEIDKELYYVCDITNDQQSDSGIIGVIPLVVRNPSRVANIESYIRCLSIAHRKVLFKNAGGTCDIDNCDEMIIK